MAIRCDRLGLAIEYLKWHFFDFLPRISLPAIRSGARRRETAGYSGKQAGDPARAAEAVIEVVQSSLPPLHLVLGRAGFVIVESDLKSMLDEVDRWKPTSLVSDYPAA